MEIKDILIKNAIKYRTEMEEEKSFCKLVEKDVNKSNLYNLYRAKWTALVEVIREAGLWDEYIESLLAESAGK